MRAACAIQRVLCVLPVAVLTACQTISARVGDEFSLDQMRADGKSMVLFHTSVHSTGRCMTITMVVAHPDGQGRWVRNKEVTVKGMFDFDPQPSQMILPPGEWGIVHLTCHRERERRHYVSRVAQRGSIWDGSGALYEHPFATFRVGEGEVVDIGQPGDRYRAGARCGRQHAPRLCRRGDPDSGAGPRQPGTPEPAVVQRPHRAADDGPTAAAGVRIAGPPPG